MSTEPYRSFASTHAREIRAHFGLEDDFSFFTSDLDRHLDDLQTFFERKYGYWICLIATSKYGPVVSKDDLVSLSFQQCTNAAGYLVSREGIEQLLPVWEFALERLKATGDQARYASDRSWSLLQSCGANLSYLKRNSVFKLRF
jgi:hypothetical protein